MGVNGVRKIGNLAWLNLVQVLRDRTGLLTLVLVPLMLTFVFGSQTGGGERRVTVAVADLDRTSISRDVIAVLDARSYLVVTVGDQAARAMASSGEAAAAVVVPKGFAADVLGGVDTKVAVVKDPRSTSAVAVVQAVGSRLQRIAANASTIRVVQDAFLDAATATGAKQAPPAPADVYTYADRLWSLDPPLSVSEVPVTAAKVRGASTEPSGFQQYSLGFTLMFMLFMGLDSAGGFLEEREQGTLSRLLATPTSKAELVAGKVVGIYATVMFEAVIMVGFGAFVFRVPWGNDPLGVVMIVSSFGLAATGLGVMISSLARTRGQVSALTAVLATSLSMLGGAYWSLDILSPAMRTIALLTPTGWAMTGLTDVVVRSQGAGHALMPTAVLLGMALVFLGVGVSRLRLE